jgi:hypothetical protein
MAKAVRKSKTRTQWAAEIIAAHKQSIEGILKMGRTLIAAKDQLAHGTFLKMIEHDLPFDATTAQRLMKIARDSRIAKAARAQLLPIAWGTLYELSKLPDAEFNKAVSSGAINPKMTREQARTVRVKLTDTSVRMVVPYYVTTVDRDPPVVVRPIYKKTADDEVTPSMRLAASATRPQPTNLLAPDASSLTLSQIEQLVGDLAIIIEHGDARADRVFKDRIRAVVDRLLNLLGDDDRGAPN